MALWGFVQWCSKQAHRPAADCSHSDTAAGLQHEPRKLWYPCCRLSNVSGIAWWVMSCLKQLLIANTGASVSDHIVNSQPTVLISASILARSRAIDFVTTWPNLARNRLIAKESGGQEVPPAIAIGMQGDTSQNLVCIDLTGLAAWVRPRPQSLARIC
jgi:hypothetical protein